MARKSRRAGVVPAKQDSIDVFKYKVAVYARLSREREDTIERGTIENQVEFVTEYVKQQEDMEIIDCYVDDAFTGTNFDRPGYNRMIADLKEGRFNTVVVKDLSRLGREYVQVGNLIERIFPLYGVRFIAILDNYDTLNRDSGIMMPVANIANTLYALDISKKIHSGKHSMMARGVPVSTPPYGYKLVKNDKNENEMVVDEEVAPVIRRMVDMFLSGKSYAEIVKVLNDENIPTAAQYRSRNDPERLEKLSYLKWKGKMIRDIFMNETYRGTLTMGKDKACLYKHEKRHRTSSDEWLVFKNHHEAIISEEEYEEIQKLRPKDRPRREARPNLFRGKIFCGKCGMAMHDIIQDNLYERYSCSRKIEYGISVCDNKNVSKPQVYETALLAIKEQIQGFIDMDDLLVRLNKSRQVKEHYESVRRELVKVNDEAEQVISLKSGLYADLREGLIDDSEYSVLTKEYSLKLNGLQKRASELEAIINDADLSPLDDGDVKSVVEKYRRKRTLSQDMVDAFIKKVVVIDGNIEIVMEHEDAFQKLQSLVEERSELCDEK